MAMFAHAVVVRSSYVSRTSFIARREGKDKYFSNISGSKRFIKHREEPAGAPAGHTRDTVQKHTGGAGTHTVLLT